MDFFLDIGLNILLAGVGFVVLIKCADFFVDGASSLAGNFKISTTVIGLTVVAFGTSAPELAISFKSHLSNNTDMLFGNVIGTNIVNILVILGVAVLINPFKISNEAIKKQIPILLLVTLGASVLLLDSLFDSMPANSITRADSIILILFFSIFVYYLITILSNKTDQNAVSEEPKYKISKSIVIIVLGLAGIIFGSNLVVDNVVSLAIAIGISQKIISVTIISIGTSLPELATTVIATRKGENNMAIGNIVGSNIFNICIVLGLPIVILGEASTTAFHIADVVFMSLSVVLLWIFSATNRELKRYEGALFAAVYCLYGVYIFLQ